MNTTVATNITFKYRFVPFGTNFKNSDGHRANTNDPDILFENEVVTDVGGRCLGYDGESRPILDHHFTRNEQFPSAAAAVLHLARQLMDYFEKLQQRTGPCAEVWLVTHQWPDFDAYSSLFLARCLLSGEIQHSGWHALGLHPEGWKDVENGRPSKIDWFGPFVAHLPTAQRWPILLAAYASVVDNAKQLCCSRRSALHAVLYAAQKRQRPLHNGALEFFMAVRTRMEEPTSMNPLTDNLFEDSSPFAPELELLALEEQRYQRDLQRARIAIVNVPCSTNFEWYKEACKTVLLDNEGKLHKLHQTAGCESWREADGIYIRDPESILFKEWARLDTQNSPSKSGFLFLAVIYSTGSNGQPRYVFSLDPERSGGSHLYPVWARLQAAQLQELAERGEPRGPDRPGYELRKCGKDPWFDGGNYRCTIIDTPNRGAFNSTATRSDLKDDLCAKVAVDFLEYGWFKDESAKVWDYSIDPNAAEKKPDFKEVPIRDAENDAPPRNSFRFASIGMRDGDDQYLRSPRLRRQIGEILWLLLEDQNVVSVPLDFEARHLLGGDQMVVVWSRRGIVVAYKPTEEGHVEMLRKSSADWAIVAAGFYGLLEARNHEPTHEGQIQEGRRLLNTLLRLRHQSSLPEGRVLRRLFDSTKMDDLVTTLQDFNQQDFQEIQEQGEKSRDLILQVILAGGSALGLLLSWHQLEALKLSEFGVKSTFLAKWGGVLMCVAFICSCFLIYIPSWLRNNRASMARGCERRGKGGERCSHE